MKYIDPNKSSVPCAEVTFKDLGLSDKTIAILEKKGYKTPTTIQAKAIPLLLEGKIDVVGQSQTGTGKTASFALPILERIQGNSKTVQAIILTPTRELALQVSKEIESLKADKSITVLPVYGGAPIGLQIQKLKSGVDIIVGTPGRVIDLQNRKFIKLDNIKYAVLDEADEMLNMGFVEDIEEILGNAPQNKSMLLFSATMPKAILNIAKKYMREYKLIEIDKANVTIGTVEQIYYDINSRDRFEALRRILDYQNDFHGIVFCNTKVAVDSLAQQLARIGYSTAALHGDVTQSQREKILQQFKLKFVKVLIATDVAARGIDVDNLTHVINYSFPQSPEAYVHRIGRTGRAGKKGISITFVVPAELKKLYFIERINKCKLIKQQLPSAKQIITNKEARIKSLIKDTITENEGKASRYNAMAKELLKEHHPSAVVEAILKHSFKDELDIESYEDIAEVSHSASDYRQGGGKYGSNKSRSRKKRPGRRRRKHKPNSNNVDTNPFAKKKAGKKSKGKKKAGARHY